MAKKDDNKTPVESSGVELVKKISTRTIIGTVKIPDGVASVDLYTLLGVAEGVKHGDSNYGPWTSFLGSFEATRVDNGKVYSSNQAFIPEPAQSLMQSVLERAQKSDPTASVQFAFMIGVKPQSRDATKYEYTCVPLIKPQGNDVLADLRAKIAGALPAPEGV